MQAMKYTSELPVEMAKTRVGWSRLPPLTG
jgi:hypothetical protein